MNKVVNKFLLTVDKFMPILHIGQPRLTYSSCGMFNKHCRIIQTFRETCNLKHIYKNKLVKACFPHDTV